MSNENSHIAIVGAGLAGSLLSLLLSQKGFHVSVFEKRIDPRLTSIAEGRSINLALSHRGIKALQSAQAYKHIEPLLLPMKGRMMHDTEGLLTEQRYGKEGQCIYSISRNELNKTLIQLAEKSGVKFQFNHKCERVNVQQTQLVVSENGNYRTINPSLIIGADGAFSMVRKAMMQLDRFDFQQSYITHGYKEISMPPTDNDFALSCEHLHIWPRGSFMLIALPNPDKTFTCTLFYPFDGFEKLKSDEAIKDFFNRQFPDVPQHIPNLIQQFKSNPTSSLVTMRTGPWNHHQSMLIGDAAHAIVPFYGQGMNAAFEDCRLFTELAEKQSFQWENILSEYFKDRKKDADAIADLALNNFIEMRDHVADENFLLRKKADGKAHAVLKEDWIPLYTMVTFSDIPYSKALGLGKAQEKALKKAQSEGRLDDVDYLLKLRTEFLDANPADVTH